METQHKNLVVLGAGESGVGAAILAQQQGYRVFVSDAGKVPDQFKKELNAHGIEWEGGKHSMQRILAADEVIKSPGIPQQMAVVEKVRQAGIRISSEIDFAARFTEAKIVAITGTNGKTTTTSLIYHLLKEGGYEVAVGGNIGKSFARVLAEGDHPYFVLEVSSFQLEDVHSFRPHVALLLNITRDHLDRYNNDMEQYAAAKFNIAKYMGEGDTFIYNADDEQIAKVLNRQPLTRPWLESFSESMYQEGTLEVSRFSTALSQELGEEERHKERYTELPLKGKHNAMNAAAAILATMRMGMEHEQIAAALSSFEAIPHRLQEVGKVNGISFINDSKATNVEATAYALDAFGECPLVWIAGGTDKGNDYGGIQELVKQKVKALICLGRDNTKLLKAFGETVPYTFETTQVWEAVKTAYHMAEKGEIVLLSPACASFDLFKNYEDRGQQFAEAVKNLSEGFSAKNILK